MASSTIKKERRRAPRYVLKPEDYKRSRMKQMLDGETFPMVTEIHDVSKNGLSFKVAHHRAPRVGSIVALEFTIPNQRQIAWYGRVVRLESFAQDFEEGVVAYDQLVRVGVSFENLPKSFEKMISFQIEQIMAADSLPANQRFSFENATARLIYETTEKVLSAKQLITQLLVGTLCLVGAYFLVTRLQELGNTRWWIEDARRFFEWNK